MRRVVFPGLVLVALWMAAGVSPAAAADPAADTVYEVVWPESPWRGKRVPLAPRLNALQGKTICELGGGAFHADKTFPMLENMLKAKYPGIKFVSLDEMKDASGEGGPSEKFAEIVKAKGCDAIITGNGC